MPQALQATVTAELNIESMFNHISPQDQLNPKLFKVGTPHLDATL